MFLNEHQILQKKIDVRITDPRSPLVATPPALSKQSDLQFILPERFTSVEQVPAPKNPRIQIKQIPERSVAVVKFSGIATEARCRKKLRRLYDMLLEENLYNGKSVQLDGPPVPQVEGQEGAQAEKGPPIFDPNQIPWTVAEYHPYLTLPPLRRNEVWIDLLAENPALQELVAQYETPPLPRPPPQQTRRSRRWGKKKIFLPAPLPPPLPPPLPLWLLMMRTRAAVRPMLMPVTG